MRRLERHRLRADLAEPGGRRIVSAGRLRGERYDDEARAAFSRAAFRLVDEFESRGNEFQTVRVLELVAESDVPAASAAAKRIERISKKGRFL